jgi:outer membrane lipoprotein-sorting protein
MKKIISTLFFFACLLSGLISQELSEILKTHFKTIGQDKLTEINSMKSSGKTIAQGMELDFEIYTLRPEKFRLEVDIQGAKMIQAYDGEKGWFVAPWTGSTDPIEISGVQLKSIKLQADMDGMLYNYDKKGLTTELVGKEDMEGTEVFKIKQTDKDGDVYYHFIDAENYVLLKTSSKVKVGESEVESETYYSNYEEFEGMMMAYSFESKTNGQTMSQINIEKVEFNPDIDPTIFTMPAKQEVPVEK